MGPNTRLKPGILVGSFLLLTGVLELLGWATPIRGFLERTLSPSWQLSANFLYLVQIPAKTVGQSYSLQRRVLELQLSVNELSAQLGELDALKAENEALRVALQNTDRTLVKSVVAAPIVSYGQPFINQGADTGIKSAQPVLAAQTLLGRIGSVTPHQAEIRLLSHSESVPVLVQTQSGVTGIVKGDGKRVLLTEVSNQAELKVGDRVITTGQLGLDRDLFVGTIREVIVDVTSPTQTAVLDQGISFYELRVVEVRL